MATIFKRKNGIFYFIYDVNGKRIWKSTGEREKRLALKFALNHDQNRDTFPRRILMSKFFSDFLSSATSTYKKGTIEIYKVAFSSFQSVVGDLPLAQISRKHTDDYKTARLKSVSPITLNIDLRTLRAAMNKAIQWRLIKENPLRNVQLMRIPEQQPVYLTRQDYSLLLCTIKEVWFRDLIRIAVFTGLRRGELLNLKWRDIDFERKLIYVHSTENFQTKAGKRRSVPMNESVYQMLYQKGQQLEAEFVFLVNGRPLVGGSVTRKFKFYVRCAGLNCNLRWHSLRHTFATWLVQEGVNIYEVQKLLGHSSVKVTEIYSHLASSQLHSAVNKIELPLN